MVSIVGQAILQVNFDNYNLKKKKKKKNKIKIGIASLYTSDLILSFVSDRTAYLHMKF